MPAQKKIESVKKIKESLEKSKSIVVTDHTGLTHKQLEVIRKRLKKKGGSFKVIKNNLLKKALEDTIFESYINLDELQGPSSLMISLDDEINPIKELYLISKELNLPKIKQGALKDKHLEDFEVIKLAQLPPKEILIAQLLEMLSSPQRRLVFALKGNLIKLVLILKAVSEKKNNIKN